MELLQPLQQENNLLKEIRSSSAGHSEMQGLNKLQAGGYLKGKDVVIKQM